MQTLTITITFIYLTYQCQLLELNHLRLIHTFATK